MMRMLICLLMLIVPTITYAETSEHALVLSGVMLEQGTNKNSNAFTAWLSKKANYPLSAQYAETYQSLSTNLRKSPSNIAWTCGVPFVQDQANDGQQLVAIPLFHGKPTYHSLIIIRAERSETSLVDFKGQVFAYSDPRSNSGFIAPTYTLNQKGLNIHHYFRYLMNTGIHENSITAVLTKQADVAAIDEYVYVEYIKSHPEIANQLKVLETLGPYPFTPIVAGKQVSPEVIARLQDALLSMPDDSQGAAILKKLGLDGFIIKDTSFYQPIADMLKAMQ